MGFRFRKSVKILPGVRVGVGVSKKGFSPSMSVGVRGARVSVGKRGVTSSVGIPGSGLSYTKQTGWGRIAGATTATSKQNSFSDTTWAQASILAANGHIGEEDVLPVLRKIVRSMPVKTLKRDVSRLDDFYYETKRNAQEFEYGIYVKLHQCYADEIERRKKNPQAPLEQWPAEDIAEIVNRRKLTVRSDSNKKKKKSNKIWWIVGGLFALFMIGVMSSGDETTTSAPTEQTAQFTSEAGAPATDAITPTADTEVTAEAKTTSEEATVEEEPVNDIAEDSGASYYTNIDGDRVQSPTYSEEIPAGASAQCSDGTYSFSQHRRGTCSHHGGVAQWL